MTALPPVFFEWLVRCSFHASILIVLVLVVLAILRRRVPVRWQCLVWAVVLVRLLLPWAPPSRLSVFNWLPTSTPATAQAWSPGRVAELPMPFPSMEAEVRLAPRVMGESDGISLAAPEAHRLWTMGDMLRVAWLVPAVCLVLAVMLGTLRLCRGIQRARPVLEPDILGLLARCSADMGLAGPPGLVETTCVQTPCLFGFFRPLLLMPEGLIARLPQERLRHVFLHELAHMKRHDVEAGWLLAGIQVLHWFNPLVWVAFRRFRSDRELACDVMALKHLRPDESKRYAETLIELVEGVSRPAVMPSLAGLLEGRSDLERRIRMISTSGAASRRAWVLGAVLTVALAGVGLTSAKSAAPGTRPAVIADSPDSYVDASGRIVDKIDYPFTDDPQAIGKWESVDFVWKIQDFDPAARKWKDDLFLKQMVLLHNGRMTPFSWRWTNGLILDGEDRTASKYVLKEMGGATYMFFEWKSGDYTVRHQKPAYYVLKKVSSDVKALEGNGANVPSGDEFSKTLQAKIEKLDIGKAKLDDITRLFGEPARYYYGTKGEDPSGIVTANREHLPANYVMEYPAGFAIFMTEGKIGEVRFHQPGYRFKGKLQVGDSLEDALKVVGQPSKTVNKKLEFGDAVLYMDVDGRKGFGYYQRTDQHVRMFFNDRKVSALYITRPGGPFEREVKGKPASGATGKTAFARELQARVDQLDISTAKLDDIVKLFGEPEEYRALTGDESSKSVDRAHVGPRYIMEYPAGFSIFMAEGKIGELRFREPGYRFKGQLQIGDSREDAIKVVGQPARTVTGGKMGYEDNVLYKDSASPEGKYDYYARTDQHVRMFFTDGKLAALFVTRPGGPFER